MKLQDGPGICFERLRHELERETPELRTKSHLRIGEQDVQEYLARQHPQKKGLWAQIGAGFSLESAPHTSICRSGKTCYQFPDLKAALMKEEISALLLHQPRESQRVLKRALEGRSIKVNWLGNYGEALPLHWEADLLQIRM